MESSIVQKAYAKVNLDLYITGIKDDGYHLIKSVMQTIDLFDIITVTVADDDRITVDRDDVPTDGGNTVVRVVEAMRKLYDIGHYHIDINKNIPVAAGLGGPSADAAAVIRAIDELENLNLSYEDMASLGVNIGADVPFLLRGGLALCRGIGEEIVYSSAILPGYILLAKPNVSISTPWAYGEFDKISGLSDPGEDTIVTAIENKDYSGVCAALYNDLEKPVLGRHPIIKNIKEFMQKNGANAALMSGSGSTVFGLFENIETLNHCQKEIKKAFSNIELVSTVASGKIMGNSIL